MATKGFLLLGVLLAAFFLISSEVAAREMAEVAKEEQTKDADVEEAKYYGGGHSGYPGHGHGHGGYPGHGHGGHGGPHPGHGHGHGHGHPGHGHHCGYGCCHKFPYGCHRCCSYMGEAVVVETTAEPHN